MPSTSPASKARPAAVDRALAEARGGRDRNRSAAQELQPSHGDKSQDTPNTSKGLRP